MGGTNSAPGDAGGAGRADTSAEVTAGAAVLAQAVEVLGELAPVLARSGFRTSEFWLLVLTLLGQTAMVLSDHLSGTAASMLNLAGSGVYLFVRTYHKREAGEQMVDILRDGLDASGRNFSGRQQGS